MSENIRKLAERRADAKIKFYKNFVVYVIVNAFLAVINGICTPEFWWVAFTVFFWGIGILAKFLNAFVFADHFDNESYREHEIQKEMEKLRNHA